VEAASIDLPKAVQFFVPLSGTGDEEAVYQAIIKSVESQMRWRIADRRIYKLSYLHDKKRYRVQVGDKDPVEDRYEVMAILESSVYIIYSRAIDGNHGMTIMVNKTEVTEVIEFA
jgi:hypothetical protein